MTDFDHIFDPLKREALSESERAQMRGTLKAYMHEHAPRAPLHLRILDTVASWRMQRLSVSLKPAFVVVAIVLCTGAGTSYAAEQALPGDTLYGVKTGLNERLRGALAVTTSGKAAWNAERADRRLREAEMLAAEGRLIPETRIAIALALNDATDDFDATIALLSKVDTDAAKVADAQSNLEASLSAHADVLSAIGTALPSVRDQIQPILALALARAESAQIARGNAELALRNGGEVREAALEKMITAQNELQDVRALAKSADDTLGSATSKEVHAAAADTEDEIAEADLQLKAGDYARAFSTYQAAIRAAKETKTGIDAATRLKARLERALVSRHGESAGATLMISATSAPTSSSGTRDESHEIDD